MGDQKLLQDKVILLTGGANGIGWECAKAYTQAGAIVCIADKEIVPATRLSDLGTGSAFSLRCDISHEEDVKSAIAAIIQKHGHIDAVHNNAAVTSPSKSLDQTSEQEWNLLMDVNLKSILFTTKHAIGHLKLSKGCILNTSSLVASIGQENHAAYVATKGAVNALTKAMALDYAPFGIRVNAVAPAAVDTPALQTWCEEQPNQTEIRQYLNALQPLGDIPFGDVIADACVFLLSNAARFITGNILPVSGGAELGYRSLL